jgi:RNA polymerase sigma-70 factor (ECF subfamily)
MRQDSEPDDDRRLVEAYVSTRDEQSFRALYRAHTPALFRMAWRLGGLQAADVEDVIQDTWLRAARRLGEFRFQSTLRTWLIGVLINCLRERRRRPRFATDVPGTEPIAPVRHEALRIDIERAVAALPPGMREVFVLFDVEGLTHIEIAGLLDIQAGTSKSQLFAARRKLRELLSTGLQPVPFRKAGHD